MEVIFNDIIQKYVNKIPIESLGDGLCVNDGQVVGREVPVDAKEQWIEFCTEALPHVEALRDLAIKHGIEPSYTINRDFLNIEITDDLLRQVSWLSKYDDAYRVQFYGEIGTLAKSNEGYVYEQTKE